MPMMIASIGLQPRGPDRRMWMGGALRKRGRSTLRRPVDHLVPQESLLVAVQVIISLSHSCRVPPQVVWPLSEDAPPIGACHPLEAGYVATAFVFQVVRDDRPLGGRLLSVQACDEVGSRRLYSRGVHINKLISMERGDSIRTEMAREATKSRRSNTAPP
jgi:hypothetical protein